MNLLEGIKHKGRPFEIPDCSRDNLPKFFKQMGYKAGAEIGVYKGAFSKKFCEVGLKLFAIDPWKIYKGYTNPRGQKRLDIQYEHTKRLLKPYPNCKIIRKTSMEAIEDFKDESLDFVHLDGNHTFRFAAEDIYEWSKKIRKGGVVSGRCYLGLPPTPRHDRVCQFRYIVDAYIRAFNITNWYLFGRPDNWLSWFWIK